MYYNSTCIGISPSVLLLMNTATKTIIENEDLILKINDALEKRNTIASFYSEMQYLVMCMARYICMRTNTVYK